MSADSLPPRPPQQLNGGSGAPQPIIGPRHSRTALFYGDEGFIRIRQARITVIGLGGVGGHAAVCLARSGIGALYLIDNDAITSSTLNRSPYAGPRDVGRDKTEVLSGYLRLTCPETKVSVLKARCQEQTLARLVPAQAEGQPTHSDLVLDAIDSVPDKIALLAWCHTHGIPVISSMGAAGKRDVCLVRTGDLAATSVCPLAREVRHQLRHKGITAGIPCVWSLEEYQAGGGEQAPVQDAADAPDAVDSATARPVLASQMTIPGVFGYGLAGMALDQIARGDIT